MTGVVVDDQSLSAKLDTIPDDSIMAWGSNVISSYLIMTDEALKVGASQRSTEL